MLAIDSLRDLAAVRFKPNRDLAAVLVTWALVTGSLYYATFGVGAERGGWYFIVYAILTAAVCGVGLPLVWTVGIRRAPVSSLGLTMRFLGASLIIQLALAAAQYFVTLAGVALPPTEKLLPLVALVLCIGFFEVIFWRGWVFTRLEEMFGFLPALVLGSALYSVYHIGYGMTWSEMYVLFWVGVFYACVFRITRSAFVLWPVLQPIGQLFTLSKSGLDLPMIAVLGFAEVLLGMFLLVWLAHRFWTKKVAAAAQPAVPATTAGQGTL